MTTKNLIYRNRWILLGLGVGLTYGLIFRILSRFHWWAYGIGVMSAAFLFATPIVMGFITVFISEREEPRRMWTWFVLQWLSVISGTVGALSAGLEGSICIVMFLPIGLVCATIGGVIAGLLVRFSQRKRANDVIAGCIMILPLLINPWEQSVLYAKQIQDTQTFIDIEAPSSVVWRNIERVPAIQPRDLPASWSHRIGFPNPVEATLSREGVGGVRHATLAVVCCLWKRLMFGSLWNRSALTSERKLIESQRQRWMSTCVSGARFSTYCTESTASRGSTTEWFAYIFPASIGSQRTSTGTQKFGPMQSWPICRTGSFG